MTNSEFKKILETKSYANLRNENEKITKLADEFVKLRSFERALFVELCMRDHRTLQQQGMGTVLAFIESMSKQTYDARNEASVSIAKEIVGKVDSSFELPYI